MRLKAALPLLLLAGLAACEALPRDPEHTLDKVHVTKVVRIGMIAMDAADRARADRLASIVARRSGATPRISVVTTEPGFAALDEGRLDVVVGLFAKESPWATDVAFGPPLSRAGTKDHPVELKAAMRNGENRWIMLVEDASRAASPEIANR